MCGGADDKEQAERIAKPDIKAISIHVHKGGHTKQPFCGLYQQPYGDRLTSSSCDAGQPI